MLVIDPRALELALERAPAVEAREQPQPGLGLLPVRFVLLEREARDEPLRPAHDGGVVRATHRTGGWIRSIHLSQDHLSPVVDSDLLDAGTVPQPQTPLADHGAERQLDPSDGLGLLARQDYQLRGDDVGSDLLFESPVEVADP